MLAQAPERWTEKDAPQAPALLRRRTARQHQFNDPMAY
jgi:hypothetical protein